jgi:SAM-dependent methyltransferase
VSGPKWIRFEEAIDRQLAPYGIAAIEAAGLRAAERVIDVGCGCGGTTIEIARRVGPAGSALGVDLSAMMLERARERARTAGVPNVRFENLDAQTHDFAPATLDLVYSRFGVMFFTDPRAAFANLLAALRPGGRLSFVCWQGLERNPWMAIPLMAAAAHIELPPRPGPEAPGPFSLGDPERVRRILAGAGFDAIALEDREESLTVGGGGGLDEAVEFLLQMGPTGAALREAAPEVIPRVREAVREVLEPFATPSGVTMASAVWLVDARRP